MDPERARIQEDLRGLITGEVRCDDIFTRLYASDASIYDVEPLGVVRPRTTEDVVAALQYAGENELAVFPRGAGTGLAGESLGRGIVLDFSRYMRRVVDTGDDFVRAQPGVVCASLNRHLQGFGRQFGPDPANAAVTTVGSMIAIDASGSHWLRYGAVSQHVRSLQIVLADGEVLEVAREPVQSPPGTSEPWRDKVSELSALLDRERPLIAERRPRCPMNRSGYRLHGILENGQLDLPRLLSGSEGTLAVITEATLATEPLPRHRNVVLLLFDRLESAARAVEDVLPFGPSACDLLDRRHLALARESDVRYDLLIPGGAEAALLVEQDGETTDEVRESLRKIIDIVEKQKRLAFGAYWATDADEFALYWRLARKVVPTLYRLAGSMRPVPFVEDINVPPDTLPEFLHGLQSVLKRHQVVASVFGHAGHGELHIRPFLDLTSGEDRQKMERLASELYDQVIALGGSVSGEHGDGMSRTPFLRRQYGPLCDVFAEVKQIFDPGGILNPGKIVPKGDHRLTDSLRPVQLPLAGSNGSSENGSPPKHQLQLAWEPKELSLATMQCNGCGLCRTQQEDTRMCPIFRFAPREEAAPRAKANLLRSLLTDELPSDIVATDDFKAIADLCVHCHQCRLECPARVDIPRLMIEAKAAYVSVNGLRQRDWFLAHIDAVSRLASRFPLLANSIMSNRVTRWLLEKVTRIAQGRKLPRAANRSFLRTSAKERLTRPTRQSGPKVLYFVDTYANYHDTQLAEALVKVLKHNGVTVYVHPEQKSSGLPLLAHGAVEDARATAAHNVALLSEAVRQGYKIVASEPSAVLCLTREYPQLLDDEEARVVADNTTEACQYLWELHRKGSLHLDFQPLKATLAYHLPCHLRALEVGEPGLNLVRLIPGVVADRVERGCSGMAGVYGLKRDNYRNSLRAGWGLISAMRELPVQAGMTECSSCKIQMEQGTTKPTVHPIKLLALAYGLMPELGDMLKTPSGDLLIS